MLRILHKYNYYYLQWQKSACENENQNDQKQKAHTKLVIDWFSGGGSQENADIDLSFNLTE